MVGVVVTGLTVEGHSKAIYLRNPKSAQWLVRIEGKAGRPASPRRIKAVAAASALGGRFLSWSNLASSGTLLSAFGPSKPSARGARTSRLQCLSWGNCQER